MYTPFDDSPPGPAVRFGTWQLIPSPAISRYLAHCVWDYVIVDMQHGAFGMEAAYEALHTVRANGAEPWIRVPVGDFAVISKALDAGATTVVVPMVNSADCAREAVAASKYPPLGRRSVGGDVWYHLGADYLQTANETTHVVVQIEHRDGVDALSKIVGVEGVDGYFAGPVDLALSLGLPAIGHDSDTRHRAAIKGILDATLKIGRMACINCSSVEDVRRRMQEGFQYISLQSDADQLMASGRKLTAELRGVSPLPAVSSH